MAPGSPAASPASAAAPVFVVGTPRSGTTLLVGMLNSHPAISCGPETALFLRNRRQRERVVRDPAWPQRAVRFLSTMERMHVEGPVIAHYGLTADEVRAHLAGAPPSQRALLEAITVPAMRRQGKRRWVEKSPTHLRVLPEIRAQWPDALFVRVVRDPRAVVASELRVPFAQPTAVGAAYGWHVDELAWREIARQDPRTFEVRYEDLVGAPEPTLRALCAFLGEPFDAAMLTAQEARQAVVAPGEWYKARVVEPVDASRADAWRQELAAEDQALVAMVCGEGMRRHGYEGATDPRLTVTIHPWVRNLSLADEALGALAAGGILGVPLGHGPGAPGRPIVVLGAPGELRWTGAGGSQARSLATWVARIIAARARRRPLLWVDTRLGRRSEHARLEVVGDLVLRLMGERTRPAQLVERIARQTGRAQRRRGAATPPPGPGTGRAKVFGIGFHKTGTTSLAAALRVLGYRVTGPNGVNDPDIARTALRRASRLVERFDAFQDSPWPLVYREMDRLHPGSKFILTVRPTDRWIGSVARHFGAESTPMREWIYGVGAPLGNEAAYVARYEQHNRDVLEHFRDRPDDLLVLRITEGEGWERLAPFLSAPIPDVPFPHENARPAAPVRRDAVPAE